MQLILLLIIVFVRSEECDSIDELTIPIKKRFTESTKFYLTSSNQKEITMYFCPSSSHTLSLSIYTGCSNKTFSKKQFSAEIKDSCEESAFPLNLKLHKNEPIYVIANVDTEGSFYLDAKVISSESTSIKRDVYFDFIEWGFIIGSIVVVVFLSLILVVEMKWKEKKENPASVYDNPFSN